MRKIWLAVVAIVLGAGTTVHAQDSMMQKLMYQPAKGGPDVWAMQYRSAAGPTQTAIVTTESAPQAPAVAHEAGPGCAGGRCAGGSCTGGCGPAAGHACCGSCGGGCKHGNCGPSCCEKLSAWIHYKPHHVCCECAHCCHVPPIYLYFVHDCTEGDHHEYPPCHCDKPGYWHGDHAKGKPCCGCH